MTEMRKTFGILFYAINFGRREVSSLASGGDHQCIAAHQGQGQFAIELAGHLTFFQPLASRQAGGQLQIGLIKEKTHQMIIRKTPQFIAPQGVLVVVTV